MTSARAPGRSRIFLLLVGGIFATTWFVSGRPVWAKEAPPKAASEPAPVLMPDWPDALLAQMAELPVQDGGRVKPLFTWARFRLLQLNGRASYKPVAGTAVSESKRSAMMWLLDCLIHPAASKRQPVFLIEDDQVLESMGLKKGAEKRKRDHYAYADLEPHRARLRERAALVQRLIGRLREQRGKVRHADLTPAQWEVMRLDQNVELFERLVATLDYAEATFDITTLVQAGALPEGKSTLSAPELVAHLPALWKAIRAERKLDPQSGTPGLTERGTQLNQAVAPLRMALDRAAGPPAARSADGMRAVGRTDALQLLPSAPGWREQWLGIGSLLRRADFGGAMDPLRWPEQEDLHKAYAEYHRRLLGWIEHLGAARRAAGDPEAVATHLRAFKAETVAAAEAIDAYGHVPMEVSMYRLDPFFWGLVAYLIGFVLLAFTWLAPRATWLYATTWAVLLAGIAVHVVGITMRCIIRGRPPVLTLYDTILFIAACAVIACLVIERINRRRVAIVLAAVLGAAGLWLASTYEVFRAEDTIAPLMAVLDTNFWLSTHVTTVTLGYAAGLLAAALGHVYLLARVFNVRRSDPGFYRSVSRMTYGVLCFGLLFSVLGTILGGIWANDSWGRFWGWDPKENGALMICLWELAILHARMGGHIRAHGMAMAAVATGPIVAFSWWGVNLLEIGLHSYGFTSEVGAKLQLYYLLEGAVLLAGLAWWFLNRPSTPGPGSDSQPTPAASR